MPCQPPALISQPLRRNVPPSQQSNTWALIRRLITSERRGWGQLLNLNAWLVCWEGTRPFVAGQGLAWDAGCEGKGIGSGGGSVLLLRRPLFFRRHITGLEPRPRDKEPFFLLTSFGCLKQNSPSPDSPAGPCSGGKGWERRLSAPRQALSTFSAGCFGTRPLPIPPQAAGPLAEEVEDRVTSGAGGVGAECPRPPQHRIFPGLGHRHGVLAPIAGPAAQLLPLPLRNSWKMRLVSPFPPVRAHLTHVLHHSMGSFL